VSSEVIALIASLCSVWGTHGPQYNHLDQKCVLAMVKAEPKTKKQAVDEWRNWKLVVPTEPKEKI
jgi:hypothetical protein